MLFRSAICPLCLLIFSGGICPSLTTPAQVSQELTVASDGSARFKSVQDAINAAPCGSLVHPTVIRIQPGTYTEVIRVPREKQYIHLIGNAAQADRTVISSGLYASKLGQDGMPIGTFRTATANFDADDLVAQNLTFNNSAGPVGQALAVRLDGDRMTFRNCRFLGWQDTVLDNHGRHYFDRCVIAGSVDFIFGSGTGVYDRCDIIEVRPTGGVLTAPSTAQGQPYGLVFLNCRLLKGKNTLPGRTSLMRPWRAYGMAAFINCAMDDGIKNTGWTAWNGREQTCRALEHGSKSLDGKRIDVSRRAAWSRQLTSSEALKFTPATIFQGWSPPPAPDTKTPQE